LLGQQGGQYQQQGYGMLLFLLFCYIHHWCFLPGYAISRQWSRYWILSSSRSRATLSISAQMVLDY